MRRQEDICHEVGSCSATWLTHMDLELASILDYVFFQYSRGQLCIKFNLITFTDIMRNAFPWLLFGNTISSPPSLLHIFFLPLSEVYDLILRRASYTQRIPRRHPPTHHVLHFFCFSTEVGETYLFYHG
jgi:hypothetical protein